MRCICSGGGGVYPGGTSAGEGVHPLEGGASAGGAHIQGGCIQREGVYPRGGACWMHPPLCEQNDTRL